MQNIIIAGAGGNLGKSVVAAFSKGNYYLNLVEKNNEVYDSRQTVYAIDMAHAEGVEQMISKIQKNVGDIDVAINLAGRYAPGAIDTTTIADIDNMIDVNFKTSFNLVASLIPHFKKRGKGKFVFIGAKAAMNPNVAGHNVAYALSKHMLASLGDIINESEGIKPISAHVLLVSTLDTAANRKAMPHADFSKWVSPDTVAATIFAIAEGKEERTVIEF